MEFTKNLDLPIYEGDDDTSWLGVYNNAMEKIDNAVGDLNVTTSSVINARLQNLEVTGTVHGKAITDNATNIGINTSSISALNVELKTLENEVDILDRAQARNFKDLTDQIATNNSKVQAIADDNVYIKKNMDKIEADVLVTTASVAKYRVEVQNLDKKVDTFDQRITDNNTDISNLQAEVDIIDNEQTQQNTAITSLQNADIVTTASIAKLQTRMNVVEQDRPIIDNNTTNIGNLKADVADLQGNDASQDSAIQNLQSKTANITDGVKVMFSFGVDASGNYGFVQPDGTIQPFFTNREWQDLQEDITDNMTDIAALQVKTSGITSGMKLPFSLAIAPGGAYGYIKNGEQGVTPWVTEEDVNKIVDLQSIEANVQTLQTNVSTAQSNIAGLDNRVANVKVGAEVPFSFGVDASGNYGYKKAGADTVTPFLEPLSDVRSIGMGVPPSVSIKRIYGIRTTINANDTVEICRLETSELETTLDLSNSTTIVWSVPASDFALESRYGINGNWTDLTPSETFAFSFANCPILLIINTNGKIEYRFF